MPQRKHIGALSVGALIAVALFALWQTHGSGRQARTERSRERVQERGWADLVPGQGGDGALAPASSSEDPIDSTDGKSEKIREWLRLALSPDEETARETFLVGFRNDVTSAEVPSESLRDRGGVYAELADLAARPYRYSILAPQGGSISRNWDLLARANVLLEEDRLTIDQKLRVGSSFLDVIGATDVSVTARGDIAILALEIQSRVASTQEARELRRLLGDGLSDSQAREVASGLRGLVSGQSRVELLARLLVLPEFDYLTTTERHAVAVAYEAEVGQKLKELGSVLSVVQLGVLRDRTNYDSLEYWRTRLGVGESKGER